MPTRNSVTHLDSGWNRTDEGYLNVRINPTRVGVFVYRDKKGQTIRELRHPEEVFNPDSLKTLERKVITDDHPPEMLDKRNTKRYQVGFTYSDHKPAADNTHTEAWGIITDDSAISKIESGKQEVSCGYKCDLEFEPGVWNGQKYDAIQRNIRYNHLSIVHRGRAGAGARIRADEDRFDACEVSDENELTTDDEKGIPMTLKKIRIDGHEVEVTDAAEIAVNNKIQNMDAQIVSSKQSADAEKTRADQLQARLDEANAQMAKLKAVNQDEAINAMIALREDARKVLGKDYKLDGLNALDVKKAVVKLKRPTVDLAEKSDAYIDERYQAIMDEADTTQTKSDGFDRALSSLDKSTSNRTDGVSKNEQARLAMIEKMSNNYKTAKAGK